MNDRLKKIHYAIVDRFWGLWYGFSTLWNSSRRDGLIVVSGLLNSYHEEGDFPEVLEIRLLYDKEDGYGGAFAGGLDAITGERLK